MSWNSTGVIFKQSRWIVLASSTGGEFAELSFPSEAQARYFAAVLRLRPRVLPKATLLRLRH